MLRLTYAKTPNRIKLFSKIIEKNKLCFLSGGMIRAIRQQEEILVVGLAYYKGKPVGSCLITKTGIMFGYNVGVYILPKYRRMGFGKQLLNYVRSTGNYELRCFTYSAEAFNLYKGCR